jgi:DNA-binding transcriptional MerR regulator
VAICPYVVGSQTSKQTKTAKPWNVASRPLTWSVLQDYSDGMEAEFTIQQVAHQTGLSIDTLRYYERIELIEPIRRASSGHRRYSEQDIGWINLLIRLRKTGMPIARMVRFAQLRRQGLQTATERRILLEEHQAVLEQQMRELEQHMEALQYKITSYRAIEAQQQAASSSSVGAVGKETAGVVATLSPLLAAFQENC